MDIAPVSYTTFDEPVPQRRALGRPAHDRASMFTLLATMEAGGKAVEVNRSRRSVEHYIKRYRESEGVEVAYVLRPSRPGFTKIWRTK